MCAPTYVHTEDAERCTRNELNLCPATRTAGEVSFDTHNINKSYMQIKRDSIWRSDRLRAPNFQPVTTGLCLCIFICLNELALDFYAARGMVYLYII